MTSNTFLYSLRVWLTSVVTAPILFILIEICRGRLSWQTPEVTIGSVINIWLFYAAFELFFSLATWFLFYIVITILARHILRPHLRMTIIFITGVLFTIVTFRVTLLQDGFFNDNNNYLGLMICNCFCIGAGSLLYKLRVEWFMEPGIN
ncbi:hypothetical protein [Mucilaginibacter sp. L3T2-6]|uniref:hypothetical protein n=1 Tax=Mucilaginibacter sp. L3T2-6 TaxID=3062491 RepID=UPI0026769E7C|nr:hypothetical protein [Mucilaginibacter sp. L3T2-6]MDO3641602.1 hypothetical protein [Mucilaginibacter sp. L3T2-6]MDV6214096.1 hypothetical protein [Mucilaginibacter sp. L3T2-6]